MAAIIPKMRSTGAIMGKLNTPQQQLDYERATRGMDNRAISMRGKVLGQMAVNQEKRLRSAEDVGYKLATRKDSLAFKQNIAAQKMQLYQKQRRFNTKMTKSAHKLGMLSTALSGVGLYTSYRDRQKEYDRYEDRMRWRRIMKRQNYDITHEYGGSEEDSDL